MWIAESRMQPSAIAPAVAVAAAAAADGAASYGAYLHLRVNCADAKALRPLALPGDAVRQITGVCNDLGLESDVVCVFLIRSGSDAYMQSNE